jgi:hypothetical protein
MKNQTTNDCDLPRTVAPTVPGASPNRTPIMRTTTRRYALLLVLLSFAGCDFLNPTSVTNPTVTADDYNSLPDAAQNWALGVQRQLSIAVNQLVLNAEVGSDNLFNNRTLFNRTWDIPEINSTGAEEIQVQRQVQRLRAMADEGLNVVVPADAGASSNVIGRLHLYRGFAHLAAGEYFVALPIEPLGPLEQPAAHLNRAIQDFEQARSVATDATIRDAALLMTARAHHRLGNRDQAVAAANQIRTANPLLLLRAQFDVTDGPTNTMQAAIYDRGDNEFQPLPRLDFLFPKYWSVASTDQTPITIAKGEEAFLIIAEARHAQGDMAGTRAILTELIDLGNQRPVTAIDDSNQLRGRRGGTRIYPNSSSVMVAASPGAQPRGGLVLDRQSGPVQIPVISGTSVTPAMLDQATDPDDLLELLLLMRQEIFVVEGRRMVDLGIRIPVALEEAEANPNVDAGSPALQAQIPSWIPGSFGMNTFDYQDGDNLAVIHHNLNRALVQNRSSDLILPFH